MLRLALLFLIIAILAAVFGFTNIAGASMVFAQVIFMVFLVLFLVALVAGAAWGAPPPP